MALERFSFIGMSPAELTLLEADVKKRLEKLPSDTDKATVKVKVFQVVHEMLREMGALARIDATEEQQIAEAIHNDIFSVGELSAYLDDPTITDILVNNYKTVFIVREDGSKMQIPVEFDSPQELKATINRFLTDIGGGKELSPTRPMVTGRMEHEGRIYRVHAVSDPVSFGGVSMAIRKFRDNAFSPEQLIQQKSWTPELAMFYEQMTKRRCNHLVAGGTGSGKTSLLNTLIHYYVPSNLRIITIETEVELWIDPEVHPDVCRWEAQDPNFEAQGAIEQWVLLKNALRFAPNIILLGEARGADIIDVLNSMSTGHPGSMTTLHCDSVEGLLPRMVFMTKSERGDVSEESIRLLVGSALDFVSFIQRYEPEGEARSSERGYHLIDSVWEVFYYPQNQAYIKTQENAFIYEDSVAFVPIFKRHPQTQNLECVGKISPKRIEEKFQGVDPLQGGVG